MARLRLETSLHTPRAAPEDLLRNLEKGDVAQGLDETGKARTSNPTREKDKRGGYRYMHLYLKHRNHIHLFFLLDKDEQDDLPTEQRRNLRLMVAEPTISAVNSRG